MMQLLADAVCLHVVSQFPKLLPDDAFACHGVGQNRVRHGYRIRSASDPHWTWSFVNECELQKKTSMCGCAEWGLLWACFHGCVAMLWVMRFVCVGYVLFSFVSRCYLFLLVVCSGFFFLSLAFSSISLVSFFPFFFSMIILGFLVYGVVCFGLLLFR